jgi:hypothetical protein
MRRCIAKMQRSSPQCGKIAYMHRHQTGSFLIFFETEAKGDKFSAFVDM